MSLSIYFSRGVAYFVISWVFVFDWPPYRRATLVPKPSELPMSITFQQHPEPFIELTKMLIQ